MLGTKKRKSRASHPGVWEVISAEWEPFHPQLGFANTVTALSFLKGRFCLTESIFDSHMSLDSTTTGAPSYFRLKLSQKQQETEGG